MKKMLFLLIFLSQSIFAMTPSQELTDILSKIKTYQAQFDQTTRDGKQIQTSSGNMQLSRPGRFRWEVLQPTHQIILIDGKVLWIYDVDLSQAMQQPLNHQMSVNPATLLTGSSQQISAQFSVKSDGKDGFLLAPKTQNNTFESIQLKFEKGQLISMAILNNLNQTVDIQFKNIQSNQPINNDLFIFNPSNDVDIIKQ